jgi:23S rRNA maturation mini-RNase III
MRNANAEEKSHKDDIKMYLKETGFEDVVWIHAAQDTDQWWVLSNAVMNFQAP